jgi:single-stranded DNA-binding protein
MNIIVLQKQANILEKYLKRGSRILLEFEVAIAKWEKEHGLGKAYKSVDAFMRHINKKLK